jgi:hypothetical protein
MTDRHVHVLRVVARHRQRRLDDHAPADGIPDAVSTERRRDLERAASRARARLAAAQARRRQLSHA